MHRMMRLQVGRGHGWSMWSVGCRCGWKHASMVRVSRQPELGVKKADLRRHYEEHVAPLQQRVAFSDQGA